MNIESRQGLAPIEHKSSSSHRPGATRSLFSIKEDIRLQYNDRIMHAVLLQSRWARMCVRIGSRMCKLGVGYICGCPYVEVLTQTLL